MPFWHIHIDTVSPAAIWLTMTNKLPSHTTYTIVLDGYMLRINPAANHKQRMDPAANYNPQPYHFGTPLCHFGTLLYKLHTYLTYA